MKVLFTNTNVAEYALIISTVGKVTKHLWLNNLIFKTLEVIAKQRMALASGWMRKFYKLRGFFGTAFILLEMV